MALQPRLVFDDSLLNALLLNFDDNIKHLISPSPSSTPDGGRRSGVEAAGQSDVAISGTDPISRIEPKPP